MDEHTQEHTLRVLEFDKILARLAALTSFSAGRELALALRPSADREEVVRRQRITAEARRLRELQPRAGLGGARDVRQPADKAARGAILQPSELLEVADTLAAAGDLRTNIARFRDELPLLTAIASESEALPELVAEVSRCIDQRAEITDAASPVLASLRRNVRIAHDRLNDRLQDFLHSTQYRDAIQEPIITLRDGRYVIPVKADQRGKIRGIVHDVSASGATVFLEPLPVVELGNTWRELQLEEEREVERVLRELSALVGEAAEAIIDTVAALAELDLALAKARLADELDAPELPHAGEAQPWIVESTASLHLLNARHPLLTNNPDDPSGVVPVTITVGGDCTVVLITGPNTGGKTVALKTAGLLALMAQAGLPVPADAASTVPVFVSTYADIGDEQSIEQSLSTFSSHMTQIIRIIGSAQRGSLVLLDELAAGTDPVEGSALARAILAKLLEIGCLVIATTHHGELKAFAHTTDGITNASVEFDPESLKPTYHLTIGLPGRSNALSIAERLGLPSDLIEAARAAIDPNLAQVETLLTDIRRERDEAAIAREGEERARGEAEEARAQAEEQLAEVEERLDEMVERTTSELERDAQAVRDLLAQAELEAERGRAKRAAERLAKALERKKQSEEKRPPKRPKPKKPRAPSGGPAPEEIEPGDLVWIAGYDRYGEALSKPDERGEVELHLGPLHGRIRLDQVERVQRPKHKDAAASSEPRADGPRLPVMDPAEVPPPELEIRGQTVDEALPTIDQYLDRAYRAALPWVRIVHGKGTGTLRRQVRDMLAKHPLVRSYESGKREEGGEGVTVVHLAE
ncbi:MAG: endonuclease MutS2 [Chloroflexi bacterium]|nr:endonuclease MutS2 [Chloroflexota bacterium]